jgi:mono/diheme cytochrome c family protein
MKNGRVSGGAASALCSVLAAAVTSGCGGGSREKVAASATPSFLEVKVARHPPPSPQTVARSREIYLANCVQCHGPEGVGDP